MIIEYFKDYDTMSATCADIVLSKINTRSEKFFNLGLPTGNTPLGFYRSLTGKNTNWSKVRTFNLDEYEIDPQDPNSFHSYMQQHLYSKVDMPTENQFFPDLDNDYDNIIDGLGRLDLTVLGIGMNGHVAFNEPGSSFESKTRKIQLTEYTRSVNSGPFGSMDRVPQHAITMGIKTILSSKEIILLAQGVLKLNVLKKSIWKNPTELLPASCLQLHNNVRIFYCD